MIADKHHSLQADQSVFDPSEWPGYGSLDPWYYRVIREICGKGDHRGHGQCAGGYELLRRNVKPV
jgi:hypothetical protein